jgi:two-component system, NtrC family, response regulator AtoC
MYGLAESGITDELLFGSSEVMRPLRRQADIIANAGLPVLIEGESGTGKKVFARALHERSSRRSRAFVKISCSSTEDMRALGESMFGKHRASALEAEGEEDAIYSEPLGTILFEDIGELDPNAQSQLASLLQDSQFSGGVAGVQIVCTTKGPLLPRLMSGSLRADLYYTINVLRISLPNLRDRRVDIPVLVSHFLKMYAKVYQRDPGPITQRILDILSAADWPGNIRELENAVKRYVVLGAVEPVFAELQRHVTPVLAGNARDLSLKELRRTAVRDCEYKVILTSLNKNHWNRRRTAQELQISYRSLLYIMEQLGFPKKRHSSNRNI